MSKFSGKCDLYDWLNINTNYSNLKIYIGKKKIPIKINYLTDLIPFYPRLVSIGYHSNIKNEDVLFITEESYVDIREKEHLTCLLNNIKSIYKSCKENHELFSFDQIVKNYCFNDFETETITIIKELYKRVEKDGLNASIKGIHLKMYEMYRIMLYEEMINSGAYTEEEAIKWVWK